METRNPDPGVTHALANGPYPSHPTAAVCHNQISSPHSLSFPTITPPESGHLESPDDHEIAREILNLAGRLGCGCIVVDRDRRIVEENSIAQRMLDCADLSISGTSSRGQYARQEHALQELTNRGGVRLQAGSLIWIATSFTHGVTVALNHVPDFTTDQTSIVVLLDLDVFPAPTETTLKKLFGLTSAEARLAFHLAQGRAPNEIAKILKVSRTTIRSQLGAIFSKTHTKRQAALVALLGRIAVLP